MGVPVWVSPRVGVPGMGVPRLGVPTVGVPVWCPQGGCPSVGVPRVGVPGWVSPGWVSPLWVSQCGCPSVGVPGLSQSTYLQPIWARPAWLPCPALQNKKTKARQQKHKLVVMLFHPSPSALAFLCIRFPFLQLLRGQTPGIVPQGTPQPAGSVGKAPDTHAGQILLCLQDRLIPAG